MRLFLASAFTRRPGAGNPAHVAISRRPLAEPEMRALVECLADGDVGFAWPVQGQIDDIAVHFFTPAGTAPFIAHVTLAIHAVRAHLGLPAVARQWQDGKPLRIEQRAGEDAPCFAIQQSPAALQRPLASAELATLLRALGVGSQALDQGCPAWIAGGASRRVLLALDTPARLAGLRPHRGLLLDASQALQVGGVFVFTRHTADRRADTESRMFAPALGIDEDPVSGNAHGMLAVYLQQRGLLRVEGGRAQLRGVQGRQLGRPGEVLIELELSGQAVHAIRIVGCAVVERELVWPAMAAASP